MAIIFNDSTIGTGGDYIKFQNNSIDKVVFNDIEVWKKITLPLNITSQFGGWHVMPYYRDGPALVNGNTVYWDNYGTAVETSKVAVTPPAGATYLEINFTHTISRWWWIF